MERQLQTLKKTVFSLILILGLAGTGTETNNANLLFAQTPSIIEHIRFSIWAQTDAYPGTEEAVQDADAGEFDYPIARIKEIVPFLMEGLVYGWNFVYTPSDKARGVEEYLEVTPVRGTSENTRPSTSSGTADISGSADISGTADISESAGSSKSDGVPEPVEGPQKQPAFDIKYSSVWIENNRFNCWVDYTRTAHEIQTYNLWASIQNPTIQGRGFGDLSLGFEGIKQAAEDALKNAVRDYYRNTIKNKPKEITGRVLLRKTPMIGINAGRYVIKLDFFLECGTILEYKQF